MQPELRERLNAIIDALERGLVERLHSVRLCLLCALAGVHGGGARPDTAASDGQGEGSGRGR